MVSREAFRVVQEGLTNALRHAGALPVELSVTNRGDGVEVSMSNPLPADRGTAVKPGGRGILGIRERVTALGGRISVGPTDHVWTVVAFLPCRPGLEPR